MSQLEQTQSTTGKKRNHNRNQRKKGTKVSMLSAKQSRIPIPEESSDDKNGIVKWGKRNEYPYYLNYIFKNNPIHAGIVRAKRYFTVAGGLIYNGPNPAAFEEFYKNLKRNHKDKNLDQLISDISLDYEKANFAFFLVRFSFVGEKKYRKMERIPFEKVRFEEIKDEKGKLFKTGNIRVSDDWLTDNPTYETIKPYNPNNKEQYSCFVMIKEESGQSLDSPEGRTINPSIYPDPPYGGAIRDIDTGIQVSMHNNAEIHNNFSLGNILNLNNGAPQNPDDKKKLERELKDATTGSLQAGGTLVLYNDGKDTAADVVSLNGNNLPDRYNNTKGGAEESIVFGHQVVVPTLFGMLQEGSFNASELEIGYSIMQANYFTARRDEILEPLNWIMNELAGIEGEITFGEVELNLPSEEPEQPQFTINMNTDKDGQDVILERLKLAGRSKDGIRVLHSMTMENGELSKEQMIEDFKSSFADLSKNELQALNLIDQGEDFDSIKKALDISSNDMSKIYQELEDQGYIDKKGEVTQAGKEQIAIAEIEKMEIMYEYALRPDAPALVPGGKSRPFCTELISLNRLYTREDINLISGVEGYDVFAYRGGWYHNPNTNKNEPGCRHEWRQVITFRP